MRKVKRKLSYKKTAKILIPFTIILILILNINNIIFFTESKITGYTFNAIKVFHKDNIYKEVKKDSYSKTLEEIIKTDYYQEKYLSNYLKISYVDNDNFLKDINDFLNKGYTYSDINAIYSSLSPDSIKLLLDNDYLKDMANILKLNYFHEDNLERYLAYSKKEKLSTENLITYVNIGLDNEYYTNVTKENNYDDIGILVNKYHGLDSKYVPEDLETISSKYNKGLNNKMRKEAKEHFEKMCEAALKDNIKIYSGSAYRSYNYQLNLYNRYVAQDGKKAAETYSARAGYSEHQTGLATDIMNARVEYIDKDDKEYDWLVANSYKYGFILRYPKDKENITGYIYEEWHFRYVGEKIAKILYNENITYDEYMARQ